MKTGLRILLFLVVIVVVFGLLIQLVPYGRNHQNPPVQQEPPWSSPEARQLVVRACYDCHSNETVWPVYSSIAPFSWLLQRDVQEGRERLNFSEWGTGRQETDDLTESVRKGDMPPFYYLPLHPSASLNAQEKQALIQELSRFSSGEGGGGGEGGDD